ncbi:MAG: 2-phosphosulfolactate phosphatase [Aeromicrobium sp.]|uniref:2-phosphosulfolactate phosphatase n=1 Tax=Aeromicrobium sp. TaxID=1871063 RepID=UPI003C53B74C
MTPVQDGYAVRFEWGVTGGAAIAADADCALVVDILSFTTTVGVAVEHGTAVIPYPSLGEAAETVAAEHGASLAGPRGLGLSLSPMSLREADPAPARLVLPSPNGATVATALAGTTTVAAASVRNARAVASWASGHGLTIAVVAAGERWPDGTLRPCIEDLWGAGAVLAALEDLDLDLSPEAAAAADAYRVVAGRLGGHLAACTSGAELVRQGFEADVSIAAESNTSGVVPVLGPDGFVAATL